VTPPDTPSFAVAEPHFAFRALAQAAARAPLGGAREGLLATLVAARLARASAGPEALSLAQRAERAAAARQWLGALSLPSTLRLALLQLLEATADSDPVVLRAALGKVTDVTAPHLDRKARSEIDLLSRQLGG
jgi:hypothetical protein